LETKDETGSSFMIYLHVFYLFMRIDSLIKLKIKFNQ